MFKKWLDRIKNWGVKHAIDALDNLEKPLGAKIQGSLDEIHKLDGYGLAKWIVDEVQEWLRIYFNLPTNDDPQTKIQ